MINIFDLIDLILQIFNWAWRWQLPIANLTIYPIQLLLCFCLVDVAENFLFPIGENDDDDDEYLD